MGRDNQSENSKHYHFCDWFEILKMKRFAKRAWVWLMTLVDDEKNKQCKGNAVICGEQTTTLNHRETPRIFHYLSKLTDLKTSKPYTVSSFYQLYSKNPQIWRWLSANFFPLRFVWFHFGKVFNKTVDSLQNNEFAQLASYNAGKNLTSPTLKANLVPSPRSLPVVQILGPRQVVLIIFRRHAPYENFKYFLKAAGTFLRRRCFAKK